MKKFEVTYHETYSATYEIEAETKEEAEDILRWRMQEGTIESPEECENSWCDVEEIDNDL